MWQWNPIEVHGVALRHPHRGIARRAARHGEPELRVVGAGGDVLVRVRFDAGGDAHEHPGGAAGRSPRAPRCGRARRTSRRRCRPTPSSSASRELELRLVVAVEHDPVGGKPGAQRDVQLPAGRDVEVEALFGDEAGHGHAQERLARVGDGAVAERGPRTPGSVPAARPRRTRRAVCRTSRRARRGRSRRWRGGRRRRPPRSEGAGAGRSGRRSSRPAVARRPARRRRAACHLVGRVDAEDRERARQPDAARLRQPEPGLRERDVVGDHPAVAVEAVEQLGEVAHPGGDAVRAPAAPPPRRPRRDTAASARSRSSSRSCTSGARLTSRGPAGG